MEGDIEGRKINRTDRSLRPYLSRLTVEELLRELTANSDNLPQKKAIEQILRLKNEHDSTNKSNSSNESNHNIHFSDENNAIRCAAENELDDLLKYYNSVNRNESRWVEEILDIKRRMSNINIQQVNLEYVLYKFWYDTNGNIKNIRVLCEDEDDIENKFLSVLCKEIKYLLDDVEYDFLIDFGELNINVSDKSNLICILAEAENYRDRLDSLIDEDEEITDILSVLNDFRKKIEKLQGINKELQRDIKKMKTIRSIVNSKKPKRKK